MDKTKSKPKLTYKQIYLRFAIVCSIIIMVIALFVAWVVASLRLPHFADIEGLVVSQYYDSVYFDIVEERYRLNSFGRDGIGVGSTRREVEADFRRRSMLRRLSPWRRVSSHPTPDINRYVRLNKPAHLPEAGFGYSFREMSVEFEFDENDIVVRMRIGFKDWWCEYYEICN